MKTNSLPDGRQRSLCTPIAALAAMAEPAAGSEQRVREPGSGRSQVGALKRCSVLIPKISRMLEATLEICVFFWLFSVLESCCSSSSPLQLLPPGAVDLASLTPVTPPTYISCSTPAATIITDMLPAWSLTPSVTVAVVFCQRARLATALVLPYHISFYYPVIGYFLFSAILLFISSLTPPLTFFSPLKVSAFFFFSECPVGYNVVVQTWDNLLTTWCCTQKSRTPLSWAGAISL